LENENWKMEIGNWGSLFARHAPKKASRRVPEAGALSQTCEALNALAKRGGGGEAFSNLHFSFFIRRAAPWSRQLENEIGKSKMKIETLFRAPTPKNKAPASPSRRLDPHMKFSPLTRLSSSCC
jgi:hypothetical protein